MFLKKIRDSRASKICSVLLAMELVSGYFFPTHAHALTSGPTQPEVENFQPVGTSDMVNVFTGDFSYNIPLLDVDGYPINISYSSGVSTDQEASWVGLGWNINPGEISRSMRGLPDDFNGDQVVKTMHMKPNRSWGVTPGPGTEVFGYEGLSLSYNISVNYNNYQGVGFEQSLNMKFSSGKSGQGPLTADLGVTSGADGINLTPSLSYKKIINHTEQSDLTPSGKIGLSFSSRSGLKQMTLSAGCAEDVRQDQDKSKRANQTYAANGGATINFATHSYAPQVSMSMLNWALAFSIKPGATFFGADFTGNVSGYYSEQDLLHQTVSNPAYGYFNTQNGINNTNALHDINREKDVAFTDHTPDLPVTNYTYDVFTVNGQGIGGNYRAFRSDLPTVYDPACSTYSGSGNLGLEGSVGNIAKAGTEISITDVTSTSGRWSGDDDASAALAARSYLSANKLYEPWYFKQAGEKAIDSDWGLYEQAGENNPTRVSLTSGGAGSLTVNADDNLTHIAADGTVHTASIPSNTRTVRQRRNQPISYLSFANAAFALQPSILEHTHPSMPAYSGAQGHHLGEITTLRSDGARYVYGLPAYNISQKEVTFAVQGRSHDCGTGIVDYSSGDNSVNNNLGLDEYYNAVQTPAYAHSYLLTAIISPDYVDHDGVEGPSKGDLGTYTKFNYTKACSDFKWRTPMGSMSANYNEGLKSESSDDKGSYVYGEKEIWYTQSIETKNYIAVFTLSDREDGLGVADEDGAVSTSNKLKKLDRIDLYTKPDYDKNGVNATPIKTVHFTYDYSLCPGIPNRSGGGGSGKLTLKTIYFTYQKSYKAKLSDYEFTYADNDQNGTAEANYHYNLKGYDRWGNYKRNPSASNCGSYDSLTTAEFPYTDQDTATANKYSAAWELTKIKLPSGGTIKVKYESDDYAYVQDKRAGEMFKVCDVHYGANNSGYTPSTYASPHFARLMENSSYGSDNYYLYFKLQQPISSSGCSTAQAADTIATKYLDRNYSNIYFRFLTDITKYGDYEYVSGYSDIDSCGVAPASSGHYNYGWIKLKRVTIGDRASSTLSNPICKAAWQFGRLNLPRKVWDQPDPQDAAVDQVIIGLATMPWSLGANLLNTFKNPNKIIRDKDYGTRAIMNKSWIRLCTPYGKKLGGGSRVKSITIGDNWKAMTNNSGYTPNDAQYGQTYTYTTTDPSTGATISSGVASYEPQIGGDENPFRQPVFFSDDKKLVCDDESYLEEPFGESFFPAPIVGYSRVAVRNLEYTNVNRHATGYTVQEFYTAKDFPTITRRTDLDAIHKRTNPILSLLHISMRDFMTASQGYVVELNDMHGKQKAQYVYAEGQDQPISEVHYFYKTSSVNGNRLDNTVDVINKNGGVTQQQSGLDFDFVNDMREENSVVLNAGVQPNVVSLLAGIFPAVIPTIFPTFSREHTRFRSTVVTKVINRYGILTRTEAHDAGSTVTTENLAWDAVTGELLLTKTKNDFDDPVYNLTYPAHWAYDHMGPAYQNLMGFFRLPFASGTLTMSGASDYFVPGDEIGLTKVSTGIKYKAWVCSASGSTVDLIDANGAVSTLGGTADYDVLITRSGRRNQQALAVGGVTLLTNPLVDTTGDGLYDAIQYDSVINAKAQEYAQHWMMFGGHITPDFTTCSCDEGKDISDMGSFLHQMAHDTTLDIDGVLIYTNSGSVYHHGFNSDLKSGHLPSSVNIKWFCNTTGQTLNAFLSDSLNGSGCTITLILPAPYTFDQITALDNIAPVSDPGHCSNGTSNEFTMDATLLNGSVVKMTGYAPCWDIGTSCDRSFGESSTCSYVRGDQVNPYYEDILGVWRPLRSSLYLADRLQTSNSGNVDARRDGIFVTHNHRTGSVIAYQPFWKPNGGNDWTKDSTYWTWSSEVTKYTPFNNEVENRDALSRYSAAVYGYNNSLPIAVASNARYQEIGYDGFEDYRFIDSTDCRYQHFNFYDDRSHLSVAQAHTGICSMKIGPTDSISMKRSLTSYVAIPEALTCPYTLAQNDIVGVFSPITYAGDKKYVLNYWVREDTLTAPVLNYPDAKVNVKFQTGASSFTYPVLTLVQKSDIIEGWQQYQYTFTIPAGESGAIIFVLKNSGSKTAYFDDIRVHPFDANMKTYVYHPSNLRFVSELDENNYATIYEYDEDGTLTRVKKETINGIMTIKESRNNSSRN